MSDYISREAAVELLSQPITMSMCLSVEECHHKIAQQRIDRYLVENIPAADVRHVVLCKDCIHCKKGKASLECEKHTYAWNNMRRWVDEDDFCKWGVKREEG